MRDDTVPRTGMVDAFSIHRFRMQYICTTQSIEAPAGFKAGFLGDLAIYADEALPVELCDTAALLGEALDWTHPTWSNADILAHIAGLTREDALAYTNRLSGRWVLLLGGDTSVALGDGGATLPVCWTEKHIASSAKLIAACDARFKLKRRSKLDAARNSGWHSGLAFLATDTEYEGVAALLPNHLLALDTRTVRRFYPSQKLRNASVEANVPKLVEILQGMVSAALTRAPLAIALTSGQDSRLFAATAKTLPNAAGRVKFFTFQDKHATPAGHPDIKFAEWISNKLGFPHSKLIAPAVAASEQHEICRASEGMIAPRYEAWAELTSSEDFSGHLIISGWASGVGRNYFSWPGSDNITAFDVLNCASLTNFPEFRGEAEAWASDAMCVQRRFGHKASDLLYWELRVGRWVAPSLNILNTSASWMTLYACRDLFERMMEIPEAARGFRSEVLYSKLINLMAPTLAELPFTPFSTRERIRHFRRDSRHFFAMLFNKAGILGPIRDFRRGVAQRLSPGWRNAHFQLDEPDREYLSRSADIVADGSRA